MRLADLLASSLASLRQRRFRTALTVLGVVIGTIAVIVMMSLGFGLSSQMQQFMGNPNLRLVSVYGVPTTPAPGERAMQMDDQAVDDLAAREGVDIAYPQYAIGGSVTVGKYNGWTELVGLPREAMERLDLEFADGGLPASSQQLAGVVGAKVNYMFFDEQTGEPPEIDFMKQIVFFTQDDMGDGMMVGEPAMMGDPGAVTGETPAAPPKRMIIPVAGVQYEAEETWGEHSNSILVDLDALVRTFQRTNPGKPLPMQKNATATPGRGNFLYNRINVLTETPSDAETLVTALREEGYQADAQIEWIRQQQEQMAIIQGVLGGIGFISLFVAAIGIANTMMMSVYERTKEIGIMKVLGAAMGDIRKMFLIEAALIGFLGGAIGLVLSYGLSGLLNMILGPMMGMGMDEPLIVSVIPIGLAIAALFGAALIGAVSGMLPARRAMKLSALGAIRAE